MASRGPERAGGRGASAGSLRLLGLIGVPFFLVAVLSLRQGVVGAETRIVEDRAGLARAAALTVDGAIGNVLAALRTLAEAPVVRGDDMTAVAELLERVVAGNPNLDGLALVDADGWNIAGTRTRPYTANVFDRGYFQQALTRGTPAISDAQVGRVSGTASAVVAVPVERANGPRRVLLAPVALPGLEATLLRVAGVYGARVVLVDRNGIAFLDSQGDARLTSLRGWPEVDAVIAGGAGARRTTGPDGDERVVAYAPAPSAGWGVVISEPAASAFADVRGQFLLAVVLVAGGAGLTAAIGWLLGRRLADAWRREQAARVSAEQGAARLRRLVEANIIGVMFARFDGSIVDANDALLRIVGYTRADLDSGQLRWDRITPPEYRELDDRGTELLRERGVAPPWEKEYIRKDGRRVPVLIGPTLLEEGGDTAVVFVVDLTDRKRVEEAQRLLVEASGALAGSLDVEKTVETMVRLAVPTLADWCVFYAAENQGLPRRLASAHADPAEDVWLRERVRAHAEDPYPEPVRRVIETGRPLLVPEVAPEGQAGESNDLRPTSAILAPLVARDIVVGVLSLNAAGTCRYDEADLALAQELARRCALALENARLYAAQRDARDEAEAALRARDEFLSIASHELRTPVTGIRGHAQVLMRRLEGDVLEPDALRRSLAAINRGTDRLAALVADLLDVSRLNTGRLRLEIQPADLAEVVRDVVARQAQLFEGAHRLVLDLPEEPCSVTVDVGRIEQVIENLLENAVKYSPEGGDVRVRLHSERARALLEVEDRGIGLPPGAAATIFEPFGRAPNAGELPGMGLGLYISRGIVEQHGGSLAAESAGEGLGTTFRLWLPATATADSDGVDRASIEQADTVPAE